MIKPTAEESADLKMALKHDPVTPALAAEAVAFPVESEEALREVEEGHDTAAPGSWAAIHVRLEYLRGELRAERVSQGELMELETLAEHINPGDVELLEPAGVPEEVAYDRTLLNAYFRDLRDSRYPG